MSRLKLLLASAVIAGAVWPATNATSHARGVTRVAAAGASAAAGDSAQTKGDDAQTKVACDLSAYVTDPDPKGTNVRSGPNKSAPVVKTLPSASDTVVKITGYSGGWFEISRAETVGDDEKVVFEGRGWVHSSLLGLSVGNNGFGPPALHAEPSKQSRVLKRLKPDEDAVKLVACKDDWAKVQFGGLTGWLSSEGQCANPLTTCP
jgi:SH3-like domain-containing protein